MIAVFGGWPPIPEDLDLKAIVDASEAAAAGRFDPDQANEPLLRAFLDLGHRISHLLTGRATELGLLRLMHTDSSGDIAWSGTMVSPQDLATASEECVAGCEHLRDVWNKTYLFHLFQDKLMDPCWCEGTQKDPISAVWRWACEVLERWAAPERAG